MAEKTNIAWCDHTFNPWVGCSKVSPACDNCYAETWARRSGLVEWGGPRRRTSASNWKQPLRWNASVPEGQRRRVFCASLADVFDNEIPDQWLLDLWELIGKTPRLDWLLLTKRIGNAKAALNVLGDKEFPENVWIGATVVTQNEFDRDVPKLLNVPARVRFLSIEPMLEPIRMGVHGHDGRLRWVICGGESGSKARPLEPGWAEDLKFECDERGIPFFMKQGSKANWPSFGSFESFPRALQVRQWPTVTS